MFGEGVIVGGEMFKKVVVLWIVVKNVGLCVIRVLVKLECWVVFVGYKWLVVVVVYIEK